MIRHLTERLPVMICPRWVFTRIQPIAIRDVLSYLVAAPGTPESAGRVIEIGGDRGWFYADWLWRLRGIADRLVGGPGFRRGRRHPDEVRMGDALDFWRADPDCLPGAEGVVRPGLLVRVGARFLFPCRRWGRGGRAAHRPVLS